MMDDITDIRRMERDMKELWKETFHDSSRYIDLVFDTYFNRDNVFVRYFENRLIASMLCIPYEFQILMKGRDKRNLRGIYLCGLSTRPEYRNRGIMAELMSEAEESWRERGYDLVFLIPADSHLREYYGRKGYVTSSYRMKQIYTKLPKVSTETDNSKLYIYTIKELLESKERGQQFFEQLASWCHDIELKRNHPTMLHSKRDMMTVMAENENSIFLTKGPLNLKNPILTNVVALAFPEMHESLEEHLRLVGLYVKNETISKVEHLKTVDKSSVQTSKREDSSHNEKLSEIYQSILEHFNLWKMELSLAYVGEDIDRNDIVPYAMIKPLRKKIPQMTIDNLKFDISLMLD